MVLQGEHAEHGRKPSRAERHGPEGILAFRDAHDPLRSHSSELAVPAPVLVTEAPSGHDHAVARSPRRIARGLDLAGEVDTADHWKATHDSALARDGKTVFVVEARIGDSDGDGLVGKLLAPNAGDATGRALGLCCEDGP